jgi:hypothetical protein
MLAVDGLIANRFQQGANSGRPRHAARAASRQLTNARSRRQGQRLQRYCDRSVVVSKRTLAVTSPIFGTSYINLYQVISWIRARESVLQSVSDYPISEADLRELGSVFAGEAKPQSWEVVALLELRTALELGQVKATARRDVPSSLFVGSGKPRILPPHFWPHLVFVNRTMQYENGRWPQERTCVCLKDHRGAEFWSDILFRADQVISVWPAKEADSPRDEGGTESNRRVLESRIAAQTSIAKLRRAPDASIHRAIAKEYDAAETTGLRPPNVKEIISPVQKRLELEGSEASGRRIQQLAGDPRHGGRRRKPGKTIASELRRK